MKSRLFIKLFTQGALVFILWLSPVSGNSGAAACTHLKINTEWVAARKLKQASVYQKKLNHNKEFSFCIHQPYPFIGTDKSTTHKSQQLNYYQPRILHQKTIPYGTEDELIA